MYKLTPLEQKCWKHQLTHAAKTGSEGCRICKNFERKMKSEHIQLAGGSGSSR